MKLSIRKGFGFGLTSGIITTLGLIIGLARGTNSKIVVLGGVALIAIADSLSDALGMHVSEEACGKEFTTKQIWEATISTVFFKFIIAISFAVPILLLTLNKAIIASIIWGIILLTAFSFNIANKRKESPVYAIFEHLTIAVVVIILTYSVGNWISTWS